MGKKLSVWDSFPEKVVFEISLGPKHVRMGIG